MRVAYLHGFASYYDPENPKVKALEVLAAPYGLDINYYAGPQVAIQSAIYFCLKHQIDLVVGTSMGGWLASHVGAALGIPFVALNPARVPAVSLMKYTEVPEEPQFDHGGYPMPVMEPEVVMSYPPISKKGCGLVIVEKGDEVFDWEATKSDLDKYHKVVVVDGGSHRFESLRDQLDVIEHFVEMSGIIYGVDS